MHLYKYKLHFNWYRLDKDNRIKLFPLLITNLK